MHGFLELTIKNTMDSLKIITVESGIKEEGLIAINNNLQGNPILEYCKSGKWIPLDNLHTNSRMSRLDDLYTQLYYRNWGIGPRFSVKGDDLYIHTGLYDIIPKLSGGIKLSENVIEELKDDMIKEIDIYYDSLISARDFLEGSSVVDLWEYPVEYGGTLNLSTLPLPKNKKSPIINLGVAWTINGIKKTEDILFTPWTNDDGFKWSDFQSPLGSSEVIVEFQDGCIRVFPNTNEVTECIIHHCSATYDGLL